MRVPFQANFPLVVFYLFFSEVKKWTERGVLKKKKTSRVEELIKNVWCAEQAQEGWLIMRRSFGM